MKTVTCNFKEEEYCLLKHIPDIDLCDGDNCVLFQAYKKLAEKSKDIPTREESIKRMVKALENMHSD